MGLRVLYLMNVSQPPRSTPFYPLTYFSYQMTSSSLRFFGLASNFLVFSWFKPSKKILEIKDNSCFGFLSQINQSHDSGCRASYFSINWSFFFFFLACSKRIIVREFDRSNFVIYQIVWKKRKMIEIPLIKDWKSSSRQVCVVWEKKRQDRRAYFWPFHG